jgi:hypothetical protein
MTAELMKVKGTFRINITEDGRLVGDSGWKDNNVTNNGMDQYILQLMTADAASKRVSHAALGTGGTVTNATNQIPGEITHGVSSRAAVTAVTSASSRVRFTATFNSANSFVTANANISNIGLYQQSNTNTGTVFAGNTYASSTIATNQNCNITYDLNFTG